MTALREAVDDFLAQKRIAVAGVSRDPKQPANLIFRTLQKGGHEVFAVNPNTDEAEGTACYHDLAAIPGGVDAVVVVTPPGAAEAVVSECADLHILARVAAPLVRHRQCVGAGGGAGEVA